MTARRKQFSSRGDTAALGDVMRARYTDTTPAPTTEQPPAAPVRPAMVTRSWYLPAEVAEALQHAADDLYHELRGRAPKHAVLAALLRAGIDHPDQARERLTSTDPQP
ncbi:MAG: hypothetical protein GEU83_14445 [Pseudonocardiaceae bacterium]|nr:hypothetical protein [Pseudonocardiaceae bacterium]